MFLPVQLLKKRKRKIVLCAKLIWKHPSWSEMWKYCNDKKKYELIGILSKDAFLLVRQSKDERLPRFMRDFQRDESGTKVKRRYSEQPDNSWNIYSSPKPYFLIFVFFLTAGCDTPKRQFVHVSSLAAFLTALPLPTILQDYGTESDRNDRTANWNTGIWP